MISTFIRYTYILSLGTANIYLLVLVGKIVTLIGIGKSRNRVPKHLLMFAHTLVH